MKKRQILELIEYLSWGFSGWGAVAAWISGDLFYAVIPLLFTVGFSVLNQQRFKRLHFRHEREIDDLIRKLEDGGEEQSSLSGEYGRQIEQLNLTQQQTFNVINQRLAQLDVRSQQLAQQLSSSNGASNSSGGGSNLQTQVNNQTLNQRLAQLDGLTRQLVTVQQELEQVRQGQGAVNNQINDFRRSLQTNQTQIPSVGNRDEDFVRDMEKRIESMQQQIEVLQTQLKQALFSISSQSGGNNQRFSQIDGINQQMVALRQQVEEVRKAQQQNISSFSQRLSLVDGFQQQLGNLQSDIQSWRKNQEEDIDELFKRLSQSGSGNQKSNSQIPSNLTQRLGQLDNLVQVVRSNQQQVEDFQAAQQQNVHMLNQKLFQLDELVRGRLGGSSQGLNNRDLDLLDDLRRRVESTQDDLDELREAQQKSFDVINQRLAQLDALVRQFDARTQASFAGDDVTGLKQAQQQTVQSLNALNSRINQIDAQNKNLGEATRQELTELKNAIALLKLQLEQSFSPGQAATNQRRQPLPSQPSRSEVNPGTVIIPPTSSSGDLGSGSGGSGSSGGSSSSSIPTILPIPPSRDDASGVPISPPRTEVSISALKTLSGHEDKVLSLAFSPDGATLASVGIGEEIHLWYLDTNEHRVFRGARDTSPGSINAIAFSPDGKMLVTGSDDRLVNLWDAGTGELIRSIRGHDGKVSCVAFHPQGDLLASCSRDKTVKLWSITTGRELETLRGHSDEAMAIAFSPRGEIIVSGAGGYDKTIKIWHLEQHKFLTIAKHTDNVSALACNPDGKSFASGSWDRTIKLWFLDSGKEMMSLEGHTDHVYAVAYSPDGRTIASASRDKTVKLWNLDTAREIRTFTVHEDDVNTLAFSPNGRYLATGSSDRNITIIPLTEILGSGGGRRTQLPMRFRSND